MLSTALLYIDSTMLFGSILFIIFYKFGYKITYFLDKRFRYSMLLPFITNEMYDWLMTNFSNFSWKHEMNLVDGASKISFIKKSDFTLFVMTWS